jgi:GTP pyrophosphokinase/guanosine-3',5'-bis(diphosphate) 3'-pyrophosphohydrolase
MVASDDVAPNEKGISTPLVIRGTEGMAIQLSTCCRPIPGDPIIGLLRKGQGLRIHTHGCHAVAKSRSSEPQNWIRVEWAPEVGQHFDVRIKVTARNIRGLLGRVATTISEGGANIEHVSMDGRDHYVDLHFLIQVASRAHLARLMRGLRRIPDVMRIIREQEQI